MDYTNCKIFKHANISTLAHIRRCVRQTVLPKSKRTDSFDSSFKKTTRAKLFIQAVITYASRNTTVNATNKIKTSGIQESGASRSLKMAVLIVHFHFLRHGDSLTSTEATGLVRASMLIDHGIQVHCSALERNPQKYFLVFLCYALNMRY
jgi:hypothetical protein